MRKHQELGDCFLPLPTSGADASGRSTGKNQHLMIFLENAKDLPDMITCTGAEFW